jgi:hypothetical protein
MNEEDRMMEHAWLWEWEALGNVMLACKASAPREVPRRVLEEQSATLQRGI